MRGGTVAVCSRLVAAFLLGISCRVGGESAAGVAVAALHGAGVPEHAEVLGLTPVCRAAGQDAVASDCALVAGVCVCDFSAPGLGGAEADARAGMA